MKTLLLFISISIPLLSSAQPANANASNFIEGGKTLIELLRVIKPQKASLSTAAYQSPDSCSIKKTADITFRNKTDKTMVVS